MFHSNNQVLDLEEKVIFEVLFNFLAKQDISSEVKELFYQVIYDNDKYDLPSALQIPF